MANRRFGMGGGGPQQQRGGFVRNFSQPNSNVSPWQGGVAPGNTGNAFQTQIALALSSLLQQNQPPNQRPDHGPPSLLSMNTPSPTFFNPNHGGNFNNANRFNNLNNRGRQDFRRNDNFNKNRAGWRSSDNNNRANNRGSGSSRNQRTNNQRSSTANARTSQDSKDNKDKKQTPIDKSSANKSEKSEASAIDDDARDDEKEEGKEDNKRDWKTEKKGENTDDLVDLTEDKEKGEAKDKDGKTASSKFDGLPRSFLHCFVCNKSMWDGESFQNHIRGKAHKQMIISLEDSFQSTVNILRENMRVAEERRVIEMQRMQRSRRFHHSNNSNETPSHCNMCNHKFLGKIVVHRQSRGHQRLKRFLHPNCKSCNAEFPSRMEWVDHLFTSEHLHTAKRSLDEKGNKSGEYKVEEIEYDILPIMEESMQNEDECPVLELTDDLSNLYNRIPAFKPGRAISTSSIKSSAGFICDLCNTFMVTEEDSQHHLRSETHYHRFVEAMKKRFLLEGKDKENQKSKKRKSEDAADDEDVADDEDAADEEDDDGVKKEQDEEEVEDENDAADETLASSAKLKNDDVDIYDPFVSVGEKEEDDSAEVEENVANSTAEDSGAISLYSSAIETDTTISANTTMDTSTIEKTNDKPAAMVTNTAIRGTGKARRGGGPPVAATTMRNGSPRSKRVKK